MPKKQFHMTPNEIKLQKKKERELKKAFEENRELLYQLIGKKVKLNQEVYQAQINRIELSDKFLKWYEENKDIEFEIESVYGNHLLILKDVDNWLFSLSSLLVVEELDESN